MEGKPRVVVADKVTEEFARRWQEDLCELPIDLRLIRDDSEKSAREAIAGAEILITRIRPVDEALLDLAGDQLQLVVKLSHWPVDVDKQACERRGVTVRMLRQLGCIAVAEHAMALILACARKLIPGHAGVKSGAYRDLGQTPAKDDHKARVPQRTHPVRRHLFLQSQVPIPVLPHQSLHPGLH